MGSDDTFPAVFEITNTFLPIISFAISSIPVVGGLVAAIFDTFYGIFSSMGQPTIWDQVKDQVAAMIDNKLVEFELNQKKSLINGLRDSIDDYKQINTEDGWLEKGIILGSMLVNCDTVKQSFLVSNNRAHLLYYAVAFAYLQVGLLAERVNNGKKLYTYDGSTFWNNDLKRTIDAWKEFLADCYNKWREWRRSFLSVYERRQPHTFRLYYVFEDRLRPENNKNYVLDRATAEKYMKNAFHADDRLMFNAYRFGLVLDTFYNKKFMTDQNFLADPNLTKSKGYLVYLLQPGDELWTIADKFRANYDGLIRFNNIPNPGILGGFHYMPIKIPIAHYVKTGDTLGGIAGFYNVDLYVMGAINKIRDLNVLDSTTPNEIKLPPLDGPFP